VVLAAAVLEHLKHADAVVREARTLLRPDGLLIVSLPNIAFWRMRLMLLAGRFDYADYGIMDRTHMHFYTLATGKAFIERAGFRVEQVKIAGSGLQNALAGLARRLKRPEPGLVLPSLFAYELIYAARPTA
jgi:SAM-dependent methyltransferase